MSAPADTSGRYLPELDGARGLGMALIITFHASQVVLNKPLGVPDGGWLGLDVFFTLSGLLITSLLLREWERSRDVDLRRFYRRRIARLAP